MNKKTLLAIGSLIVGAGLIVLMLTLASPARGAQPQAPNAWPGYWQMGPNLDATILGCPAGNGLGRFTGVYYEGTNLIYFLGGRCEDNTTTTGSVFTFDPVNKVFATTGAVMTYPISNYTLARIENDGRSHGVGLYIIGGRLGDGTQTPAVQVYYPDDNTIYVDTANPFPDAPARAPGAVVTVDDKLYVFGGFDGAIMYATTHIYDPNAATGSRWTNTGCNLPTGRAYIASAAVGTKIYSIGGDEYIAASLVALDDTEVLDTANMAACWSDAAMADLPSPNDNTQAVYVNEGVLAGGIYMVGGGWATPGPYRWVFRYDVATDTWDDTFPQLVIPDPATGRRNHALVYVPSTAVDGVGTGIPGMWAFGGYDGSGVNVMSESSEFYSYLPEPVVLIPDLPEVAGLPGTTVNDGFILQNNTGMTDTFDLSVTSDMTWTYNIPGSVGPVGSPGETPFLFSVDIPAEVACPATGVFTVTATSVLSPTVSGSQAVSVRAVCGISGIVLDATTGDPIANAYVWAQTDPDGLTGEYFDGFTNVAGNYVMYDVTPGTYYMAASAQYHQASFYPDGWPDGAIMVTVTTGSVAQDFQLVSSLMAWTPDSWDVTFGTGSQEFTTLTISNTGTGPLQYSISVLDSNEAVPPKSAAAPVPGLPRIDPQLIQDLSDSGSADFVVVLSGQADLSAAYGIQDWNARGEYVYKTLSDYANQHQTALRSFLTANQADYTPLFIINAVIVRGGKLDLVNSLAARADVAQIVANRKIAVEGFTWVDQLLSAPVVPQAVEWGIQMVNADDVWTLGYTGEGMVVAEVDTGTQWDHPALKAHYRGWDGATADHNYNWFDPYKQSPGSGTIPGDARGHGTHVMGTMVGDDGGANQVGMAPGAKWISCKGGDNVSGFLLTNELLQCAQWIAAPTDVNGNNPDPTKRPNVVNNSWGGGSGDYWFSGAVDSWRAAGIFPAFSNGNSGPTCTTAGSPGDNWNTFASGATDISDLIAGFSSRGPAYLSGILKPQISAPGANIRSSVPGNGYANYSGTSMASPHTAGAVALLWSAAPELTGQIDLTGWLLEQYAAPKTTDEGCGGDLPTDVPNNTYGWGRLDIQAAVVAALAGVTPDWVTVNPANGVVMPGETAQVTLAFDVPVTPGVYTATLWITADDPYNPDVRLPIRLTAEDLAPVAGFTSNSPVQLGSEAQFTNTTTGSGPRTYLWTFGDEITSTEVSPAHVYAAIGVYTVTLTATNTFGTDSVVHTFEVVGVPPQVTFVSNSPVMLGEAAVFTPTVTGTGPFTYLWTFGDGITSTESSPSHIYEVADTYTVTVEVTSDWGTATYSAEFVVNALPLEYVYMPIVRKAPLP